jgi:hypothetical protein
VCTGEDLVSSLKDLRRDSISRTQMRPKVARLAGDKSKVETFETLKIFQVRKKSQAQEEEHNSHQISCRGRDLDH